MLRYLDDRDYSLGMIRDLPGLEIPPGGVYDQLNMLNDLPGIARQRGGSTALVSGAQTAFDTMHGFCYSADVTPIEELYGYNGKSGVLSSISKTTGAATTIATVTGGTVGRPVRHFGFVIFPGVTATGRMHVSMAGQTVSTTFVNAATYAVAAGSQTITLSGADVTTNIKVGGIFAFGDTLHVTYARVVAITAAKTFTVWPVPTWTDAACPIGSILLAPDYNAGGGGACAASFQNRLLVGNLTGSTSGANYDRRVAYSPLPTEITPSSASAIPTEGAEFVAPPDWPALNYFDVPGGDPIVAMEPTSDNELLILTTTQPVIFRGNLVTQLSTTSPSVTFDLAASNQPYGCLSDLSVQRTSRGIVWAGIGGIYAYNGGTFDTLTGTRQNRRIGAYWRSLSAGSNTLVIHGSFYSRGHYVISGTTGGTTFALACNMDNLQWTRLSGSGTDIFYGLQRPTVPSQVYVSRWWDAAGAAPSMTNGQTLRAETMFDPYVTGATKLDADGAAVAFSITTRVLLGDVETQKIMQRATVRFQAAMTTAATTVTGQSKIDPGDIVAASVRALGTLSNTEARTITTATNATPIVVTTSAAHGLQTDDFVDINAVLVNLNANGRYRITVTGATTFSLNGSVGNGAGTGGSVKKVTETDLKINSLDQGQGVSFTIANSATVNNFELHGFRVAYFDGQQVLSA